MSEMKCPKCKTEINIGSLIRSVNSKAQQEAARRNGAKGGRPKKIIDLSQTRIDSLKERIAKLKSKRIELEKLTPRTTKRRGRK